MEAEWFGARVMEKLIESGFDYLKDQFIWKTGMKEELQRLRDIHPKIPAVVDYASSQAEIRDQNPVLNRWLWQLRDAIDEADDLLDEFEYMKHQKLLSKNKKQTKVRSAMKSIKKRLVRIIKPALHIDPNLKRLEEVVQKLDKVLAFVDSFHHDVKDARQEQQERQLELYKTRERHHLPTNYLVGRGEEKEFVMQWLRKPSNEEDQTHFTGITLFKNISLLSIVGLGGMGKTTLLQHIYEDEMTKEFHLKMWVCVSHNFDAKKVIADMLEYLTKERPRLESLDTLQESLKSAVKSKKFLLVLDDIWEEEEERDKSKWEDVLAPLAFGSLGSKILVTTRMESVASMIAKVIKKKKEILRLGGLAKDECFQILVSHAFADVENPEDHKGLGFIAKEIVEKLSGSALAAKVVGGVLNSSLDERHWIKVLNDDISCVQLGQNDILSVLRLSYIFLPKYLQKCFAFVCIFPHNHEFDKDDLVRMWIALGFIQPSYIRGETEEDIGGRYFDVLIKKSFFEKFQTEDRIYYRVHELLHELAQSVSAKEYFRVVSDNELSILETIRHLSVETSNLKVLREVRKFKNLRSLFLSFSNNFDSQFFATSSDQSFFNELAEIFEASRNIRLLYIHAPLLKMIPEKIKYLIHLRYLKIVKSSVTLLPRSLSNLYHLQFLIYDENAQSLPEDFLPRDMNNLYNLHYLKLPWHKFPGMNGIGKLNSLQVLDEFYVKNKTGYKIQELEHMNELRQLRIKFLENVKDAEEAFSAKLCDKSNLMDLSLEWGDIPDPNLDEKVLDNLQPHENLKKLRMHAYMGVRSAIWMYNVHLISKLEYVQLDECLEWRTLPPFGQLPFLKSLYLHSMPKVERLDNKFDGIDKDCVFPKLEVLHIKKLEALEVWFDAAAANHRRFPCLTELYLKDCPNLQELPALPPKLNDLEIDNIGWKTFNWLEGTSNRCSISIQNCSNLISLRGLLEVKSAYNFQHILSELVINDLSVLLMEPFKRITSLEKLTIQDNDELVSFPIEAELWFLPVSSSLCELYFDNLESLQTLPSSLESLSSLKILHVREVPHLQQLPNIPCYLERLELVKLESLQCLPSYLSTSSLTYLELANIPLQKLSDLPPSLSVLKLEDLYNLDCLPSFLASLYSLQKLFIFKVPQLRELPDLPPSLCVLKLGHLDHLNCLPYCLPRLSSLQELRIDSVPQLRELPDLPPSLKHLSIENCHPELMERYKMFSGSNWHKIAHIPHIRVSNKWSSRNHALSSLSKIPDGTLESL